MKKNNCLKNAASACAAVAMFLSLFSCGSDEMVYRDANAPEEKRVEDLLSRMTREEKILQATQSVFGHNTNPNNIDAKLKEADPRTGSLLGSMGPAFYNTIQKKAIEETRLGIPVIFGFDVIHGYMTLFPIPLAQSCSWNPEMVEASSRVAAKEAAAAGINWTFSPMLDVARDVRWGRVSEGYGEDPYLTSVMGCSAVRGYQGDDLKAEGSIASCLKHFVGYAYSQGGRDYQYTEISRRSLWETALPPFQKAVEEGAATVMSAFNDISGVPATANHYTLTEVLRDKWGFDGFVVTDWNAVRQLKDQGVAADNAEACLKAITAGSDMDMSDELYPEHLDSLITCGALDEKVLDEAVRRILRIKFRLGLFEHPYIEELPLEERVLAPEDRRLARAMASESMVLLENDGILPLDASRKKIFVTGPLADDQRNIIGTWVAQGRESDAVSIYDGLKNNYGKDAQVTCFPGCDLKGNDRSGFAKARRLAAQSDVAIVCLGEFWHWTGENSSKADIALPSIQQEFLKNIAAAGKPVVLLLSSGRPLDVRELKPYADAMLEIWQPGTECGNAVHDILTGKENPSGRLTISFPYSSSQSPVFYNQRQSSRPQMGRYKDMPATTAYPFGYGLSYTEFEYGGIRLDKQVVGRDEKLIAEIDVTNTGNVDGKETVLWFIRDVAAEYSRPVKELKHFEKQMIPAGETRTFRFVIDPQEDLSYTDGDGGSLLEKGEFRLLVKNRTASFRLD